MKCIKMTSIEQMNQTLTNVIKSYQFEGLDESNEPIFDYDKELPIIDIYGSVKLHGTNGGINFDMIENTVKPQKKSNFITPEKDNYSFAFWFESNKSKILEKLQPVVDDLMNEFDFRSITFYGEWAGKAIQKNVAISELPKSFYIFGIKVVKHDGDGIWVSPKYLYEIGKTINDSNIRMYNIWMFRTFTSKLDLNNIDTSYIEKFLKEVEDNDPVAQELAKDQGIELKNTTGEGIVFWLQDAKNNWVQFKVKGEKHSKTKVKKFKKVDIELENLKREIAEKVTPGWRLNQAIQEVFGESWEKDINRKRLGEVIKWVNQDILKEELQTISEAGLEPKQIFGLVAQRIKEHFFNVEKESIKG